MCARCLTAVWYIHRSTFNIIAVVVVVVAFAVALAFDIQQRSFCTTTITTTAAARRAITATTIIIKNNENDEKKCSMIKEFISHNDKQAQTHTYMHTHRGRDR